LLRGGKVLCDNEVGGDIDSISLVKAAHVGIIGARSNIGLRWRQNISADTLSSISTVKIANGCCHWRGLLPEFRLSSHEL
jgi:hypothetical protein